MRVEGVAERTLASVVLALLATACAQQRSDLDCTLRTAFSAQGSGQLVHQYRDLSGVLKGVWKKDCITADPNFGASALSASESEVALVGLVPDAPSAGVLTFRADSGELLWKGIPTASAVGSSPGAFYVATQSGQVLRVRSSTGLVEWSSTPFSLRSVASMHVEGQELYLYSQRQELTVLDAQTGRPEQIDQPPGLFPVFRIAGQVAYGDDFRAVVVPTGRTIWGIEVVGGVLDPPLFLPKVIVVRGGLQQGEVVAIRAETGTVIWRAQDPAITNIATDGVSVYFITRTGMLQRLAIESGNIEVLGRFDPQPVLPSDVNGPTGGFYIALTGDADYLFALLGDSAQLFAFSLR